MTARCTVDAPDAFAAFLLARRVDLVGEARIVATEAGFGVALETPENELAHLLRLVQAWLDDERIGETTVHWAGREERLRAA